MSDEERTFQRPETVPIWAEVKDWDGNYVDPSEGVTLTLYDPKDTKKVDGLAMTKSATGKYVYHYASQADDEVGWWRGRGLAQDGAGAGAKITIKVGGFYLQ